ncbi:hypothetical protein Dsin_020994 [Dipteronia sinensis]|uniref:Uncharacterized protein n=1 Tax=Dipteronia sinensis TaxID=43782 RepID=A0AAE0ABF0_9ROSI|nr:hypothetical protein Dsin_020994 [Dipteronia sinensis]
MTQGSSCLIRNLLVNYLTLEAGRNAYHPANMACKHEKKGVISESSTKSGMGTTDSEPSPETMNLPLEITKIIEAAVKAGTNLQSSQGEETNQLWNLEVEVAKVIKTGVALGLDFSSRNGELVNEILKREVADVERYKEMKKGVLEVVRRKRWVLRALGGSILNKGIRVDADGSAGGIAQGSFSIPWVLGGDFNTVLEQSERLGGPCIMSALKSFNEFTLKAKMVDIPMQGSNFMWSNNKERNLWAKLDQFLLSPIVLSWFPNLFQ